ncbi:MAG: putative lipid II flippase FtsW [Verrucomicrobiota bacterium]
MFRNSACILIVAVFSLVALGLVMLLSVSAFAPDNRGDAMFFIVRQSAWLGLGVIAGILVTQLDYQLWVKYAQWFLILAAVLMIACFIPGIGTAVKGAHRWLNLGFAKVQPSEFAKLAVVAFMAFWLGKHQRKIAEFKQGFAVPIGVVLGIAGILVFQPDLGTAALILLVAFLLMFIAGVRLRYILPIPVLGFLGIIGIALAMPERRGRLLAFINPENYRSDEGYQVWQALVAFGSGGTNGLGLGNSVQKMFYLPEAHTDFIFPIIGEELGLMVTLGVVLCFLMVALTGGYISYHAPDAMGVLLGFGATALICIQAGMNIAVVTAMVPAKGIGLPFISYGGSNLVVCLACIGILLNIHRQAHYELEPQVLRTRK